MTKKVGKWEMPKMAGREGAKTPNAKHKALEGAIHRITRKDGKYQVHNPAFAHNKSNPMSHKKANELRKTLDISVADEKRRGLK